ncbi:MAG TPA: hypothetical protein VGG28_31865 [Kofleriaceae bacterium]|jgi:hypothetical protein
MPLPGDVVRALAAFPADARTLLDGLDGVVPELARVARCVIFLAAGDPAKLVQFADAARLDYRDVIWWAEYDGGDTPLRSFMQPLDQ